VLKSQSCFELPRTGDTCCHSVNPAKQKPTAEALIECVDDDDDDDDDVDVVVVVVVDDDDDDEGVL
jgi:hypothetical protein